VRKPTEVIYNSEGGLENPGRFLSAMWKDLFSSWELAWRLMVRDINAKYRQSLLGFLWAFVPSVVMAFGFTLAKNQQVINIRETNFPYPAYVMFSMVLWQTFVEALNGPLQAVIASKPLLARVNFPHEAIILAKIGEVFFNFGVKLLLVVSLFIWFRIPVTQSLVFAPWALLILVLLGTFLGMLLVPLGVLYQDIPNALMVLTGFWLFITPVVYPVPSKGIFGVIVGLNPVTPLLETIRELATFGVVSNPAGFWIVTTVTIVGLFLAWIMYRLAMPALIERISS